MNAKISVFVICVKAIIYLFLNDLHDCTFNISVYYCITFVTVRVIYYHAGGFDDFLTRSFLISVN